MESGKTGEFTIIECGCGWRSRPMSAEQKAAIGVPWYCEACDAEVKRFTILAADDLVGARAAAALINKCDSFGRLHIVVGDGNMEDHCLAFCREDSSDHDRALTSDETACLDALAGLTLDQRDAAYEIAREDRIAGLVMKCVERAEAELEAKWKPEFEEMFRTSTPGGVHLARLLGLG